MTHKSVGIILALIIISAFGAWMLFDGQPTDSYRAPAAQPPGQGVVGKANDTDRYDVLIAYTDDGYATTSITIKQGTRVRFLNTSSVETWPASGIHPTHTLYPEKQPTDCLGSSFDSCARLAPGEFFDFTFFYPGEWPFHDHVHGYHSGVIIVE